jgi:anhydro-N-acetylmuramic acid kinase
MSPIWRHLNFGPTDFQPYDDQDRALLRAALARAADVRMIEGEGPLREAQDMVTDRHARAVEVFLAKHPPLAGSCDVVGFHGQTVLHRPKDGLTLQIGDGQALADRLGIGVVYDFRRADIEAGGEGAPIAPIYHAALAAASGLPRPLAFLNVGGVANVTFIPAEGDPIACDTGPGNALLDDLMLERTGAPYDRDGAAAAHGRVDPAAIAALTDHPYFSLVPPKSLDRNQFSRAVVAGLSTEDAAATLVAFTAATVADAVRSFGADARTLIVCGGGARNPTLLRALRARLDCPLHTADELGWAADAIEAQAFAYLAVRSLRGLPITFPTTTGVPRPLTGGRFSAPSLRPRASAVA